MIIDEAIETLEGIKDGVMEPMLPEESAAIRLGIEALRRVQKERTGYELYAPDLLPGETKE